jgi:hypothetical protein
LSAFGKAMQTSIKPTNIGIRDYIRDDWTDNVTKFNPITDKKSKVLNPLEFSLPIVSISDNFIVDSFKKYKKWLQMKRMIDLTSSTTDVSCKTTTMPLKSSTLETTTISASKMSLNNRKNKSSSTETLFLDMFLSHEKWSKSTNRITLLNKCVSGKSSRLTTVHSESILCFNRILK